jgi:hypothetical protein
MNSSVAQDIPDFAFARRSRRRILAHIRGSTGKAAIRPVWAL